MCYIEADDYVSLKEKFELCRNKLNVAEKYNVSGRIFDKNSLMFESIIDNINSKSGSLRTVQFSPNIGRA